MDALTFPIPRIYSDDILLTLGTDKDIALVERSTALGANTALTGVLVGTPVTNAVAANSLILGNVTASGDILIAANRGGNSEDYFFADSSAGVLYLSGYLGGIGLGLAGGMPAPDNAAVHIWNATAGTVTANANSQLIIEGGAATEISILSPDNAVSGLTWGNPTNASHGQILYSGPTTGVASTFRIFAATTEALRISSTSVILLSGITLSTTAGQLVLSPTTQVRFTTAFRHMADSTNNEFNTASQGAATTTMYIGNASINVTSDVRVKEDFTPYRNGLALIKELEVQEYSQYAHKPIGGYEGRYVGFTAQHLQKVAPWAVNVQGGGECLACQMGQPCSKHLPWQTRQEFLMGPVVQALQEIDRRVAALERM